MATTPRQEYWQNLRIIHSATGEWNRCMAFHEAREWVDAYNYDKDTGYPTEYAAQRAYDIMFAVRRGMLV